MAMNRQDEMGAIDAGKLANLVFLAKDPMAGPAAYRTVVLTVKRGALYWRRDYKPVTAAETGGRD